MRTLGKATRYAVLGTGALGGFYGSLLNRAGCDVHFLLRSDYQHVRQHGMQIDTPLGSFRLNQPKVFADVQAIPEVDVVLVCWKSTQNGSLREALQHLCRAEGSCVLVLQNGLDVERTAADIVGDHRVLGGCCFLCCNKIGPGHICHLDYGRIAFGEYSAELRGLVTDRMQLIANDFRRAGIEIEATPDLVNVRWRKLMWNIPYNGLSVILQADTGQMMADPHARQLVREVMTEVRDSAVACGHSIEDAFIEKLLKDTEKMVPYDSSMLLDYRAKRPMEVETIFGNPLRAAQKAGFNAPRVACLYRQLAFLNQRNIAACE